MTRLIRLIPLAGLILAACAAPTRPATPPSVATPEGAPAAEQRFPDVLKVELVRKDADRFDVVVTISSPYDTPERYADGWRVLAPDGAVLGAHTLTHDHANEQPFTRTQSDLVIPTGVAQVTVEGRDKTHGFGGKTVTVAVPASATTAASAPALLPVQTPPAGATTEFSTDFSKSIVRFDEVLSGGPPKDGIPAIDAPKFISVAEADAWLKPNEPVALINVNGDARAYPVQVLTWHEIVNDAVGGVPLAVTYCPLCNTAIAFERTFDGRELDFGTTGRLRYSNLIMYDRQTETWWQQGTGQAIAGLYAGQRLTQRPMTLISWADFKAAHPDGQVLDRDTGFARSYGRNPYIGYDNPSTQPFLYQGPATPNLLPALARVFALNLNGDPVAFPYDALAQRRALTDVVGGEPVVVLWTPGTASALDAPLVADGRDVGAAASYSRVLDGQTLDFAVTGDAIVDAQTGSRWDGLGRAVDGPLKGKQLTEVVGANHFWFSWAAFHPTTRLRDGTTP